MSLSTDNSFKCGDFWWMFIISCFFNGFEEISKWVMFSVKKLSVEILLPQIYSFLSFLHWVIISQL